MEIGYNASSHYNIEVAITTPEGELYSLSEPSRLRPGYWKCWIASAEGERFEVAWRPTQPDAIPTKYKRLVLRATVYIDGVEVQQGILEPRHWLAKEQNRGRIQGQQVDSSTIRHFQWGPREALDTEDNHQREIDSKDLNTIRVVVEWGTQPRVRDRKVPVTPRNWSPIRARLCDIKLGNTSVATLGDPLPFKGDPRKPLFRRAPGLDPRTFLFKYASEEWLKRENIELKDKPSDKPIFPKDKHMKW